MQNTITSTLEIANAAQGLLNLARLVAKYNMPLAIEMCEEVGKIADANRMIAKDVSKQLDKEGVLSC